MQSPEDDDADPFARRRTSPGWLVAGALLLLPLLAGQLLHPGFGSPRTLLHATRVRLAQLPSGEALARERIALLERLVARDAGASRDALLQALVQESCAQAALYQQGAALVGQAKASLSDVKQQIGWDALWQPLDLWWFGIPAAHAYAYGPDADLPDIEARGRAVAAAFADTFEATRSQLARALRNEAPDADSLFNQDDAAEAQLALAHGIWDPATALSQELHAAAEAKRKWEQTPSTRLEPIMMPQPKGPPRFVGNRTVPNALKSMYQRHADQAQARAAQALDQLRAGIGRLPDRPRTAHAFPPDLRRFQHFLDHQLRVAGAQAIQPDDIQHEAAALAQTLAPFVTSLGRSHTEIHTRVDQRIDERWSALATSARPACRDARNLHALALRAARAAVEPRD